MPVRAERESLTDSWQVVCGAGIRVVEIVVDLGLGTGFWKWNLLLRYTLPAGPCFALGRYWLSRDGYRVATGSRPVRDGGGGVSKGTVGSMSALTRCYPGAQCAIRCYKVLPRRYKVQRHPRIGSSPCA